MNRGIVIILVVAHLAVAWGAALCRAQDGGEQERLAKIRAAFLLNFARYGTWPETAFSDEQAPLVITVVGRAPVLPFLQAIIRSEKIEERQVEARQLFVPEEKPDTEEGREAWSQFEQGLRRSHMVYLPEGKTANAPAVLKRIAGADVMTVGDIRGFVDAGGMLELHRRRDRMTFLANMDAIEATGIKVSSKVLRLAESVKRKETK